MATGGGAASSLTVKLHTCRNGGPPALDAAELQAISDSIVRNQGKNADQDTLIAALQTAVGGKARIEVGSYVGTGTYGADNPCSLTCSFAPKFVWVYGYKGSNNRFYVFDSVFSSPAPRYIMPISIMSTSFVLGQGFFLPYANTVSDTGYGKISSDRKTITWYIEKYRDYGDSALAAGQLNGLGVEYHFIFIG